MTTRDTPSSRELFAHLTRLRYALTHAHIKYNASSYRPVADAAIVSSMFIARAAPLIDTHLSSLPSSAPLTAADFEEKRLELFRILPQGKRLRWSLNRLQHQPPSSLGDLTVEDYLARWNGFRFGEYMARYEPRVPGERESSMTSWDYAEFVRRSTNSAVGALVLVAYVAEAEVVTANLLAVARSALTLPPSK